MTKGGHIRYPSILITVAESDEVMSAACGKTNVVGCCHYHCCYYLHIFYASFRCVFCTFLPHCCHLDIPEIQKLVTIFYYLVTLLLLCKKITDQQQIYDITCISESTGSLFWVSNQKYITTVGICLGLKMVSQDSILVLWSLRCAYQHALD